MYAHLNRCASQVEGASPALSTANLSLRLALARCMSMHSRDNASSSIAS
jgi:hypothetical protein